MYENQLKWCEQKDWERDESNLSLTLTLLFVELALPGIKAMLSFEHQATTLSQSVTQIRFFALLPALSNFLSLAVVVVSQADCARSKMQRQP